MSKQRWMKRAVIAPLVIAILAALTVSASAYDDVPEGRYYSDAVAWLDAQEITNGTSATDFSPHRGITRAEFLTLLWRLAGSPAAFGDAHVFGDTPDGGPFATAIDWAFGTEIAMGRTTAVLDPDAVITRAEALAILWRYMCRPTGAAPHGFGDVAAGAYFDAAAAWAKADGVAFGRTTASLDPDAKMTRAEAAAMLWRLAGSPAPNGAGINRTTDAPVCGGGVSDVPVNTAPVLDKIPGQEVQSGDTATFTATATDADVPAQTLTFSLGAAPEGATITESGEFSWPTPKVRGEEVYAFDVIVTDDGDPALSDSQTVEILVYPYVEPCLETRGLAPIDPCEPCLEISDIGPGPCDPCFFETHGLGPGYPCDPCGPFPVGDGDVIEPVDPCDPCGPFPTGDGDVIGPVDPCDPCGPFPPEGPCVF